MADDDTAKPDREEKPDADTVFAATLRNLVNTPPSPHKPKSDDDGAKPKG